MSQSNNVEELLTNDSFVAWIEDAGSDEEARHWEAWLEEDPARKKLVETAKSLHENLRIQQQKCPEVGNELSKLNDTIDSYERKGNRNETNITPLGRMKFYSSAAAVAILLITIIGLIAFYQPTVFENSPTATEQQERYVTTTTAEGQQKVLTLYDGSKITLNANSTIRYPATYSGGDLAVTLKGEAYFDIDRKTGDEERTFSVNIPGATVEVLGTEFNINSYGKDSKIMLVQGRVSVSMRHSAASKDKPHIMEPGQLSTIYSDPGRISTRDVNADLHTAWTQDKLVFDRASLHSVAERIGNIYNVEFQLDRKELKEIIISGSLPNDNLDVFLNALEKLLDRRIINNDGVIVLGEKL
ncbi:MAG: FecR domain-containing protein [Fodinibius sp.]|nr:FecR domain-containing protein [Fodinibius sp.]